MTIIKSQFNNRYSCLSCYVGAYRVANGGQHPHMNMLNKQSRTADKGRSSSLCAGRGANSP